MTKETQIELVQENIGMSAKSRILYQAADHLKSVESQTGE